MADIPSYSIIPFYIGFVVILIMTWVLDNALSRSARNQQNCKLHRWLFIILAAIGFIAFVVGYILRPEGVDLLLGSHQNISPALFATIGTTGIFVTYMAGNFFRMTFNFAEPRGDNGRGVDEGSDRGGPQI